MINASISQAKDRLSALIKQVQGGESVVITDRSVPVAELVPVRLGAGVPARILGLAQEGLVRLPETSPTSEWLEMPWPCATPDSSAVDLLIEERRTGR